MSLAEAAPRGFQCCFCGANVPAGDPCLIHLALIGPDDGRQELWGHAACLRKVVQPGVPLLLPEQREDEA